MMLRSVYAYPGAETYLYALLSEREPEQNISHRGMPTVDQHLAFVRSRPYREWHLITVRSVVVGAVYLTRQWEIGIFIFKAYQGKGHGRRAVQLMRKRHAGRRLLANVNPANAASIALFTGLGGRHIQQTYEMP